MKSTLLSSVGICFLISLQTNAEERSHLSTCGRRFPAYRPLILDGIQSTEHWPWHVAIYHVEILRCQRSRTVKRQVFKCGGSLIDSNTVLTVAHCISQFNRPMNPKNVLVSLGKQHLSAISEFFKVKSIIQHPSYSHVDLRNDIAIIKIAVQVTFDDFNAQPICLWDSNKLELSEVVGTMGTVVGWGKTGTGPLSNTLQESRMPVVDHATCLESDRIFFSSFISTNTFCAGFVNGTSVCKGDSGGALAIERNGTYYIRGIVSLIKVDETGDTCDKNKYTLFTDVAQYLSWIGEVANLRCEKRVSCEWNYDFGGGIITCEIHLNVTLAERNCKIIIEETNINLPNSEKVNYLQIMSNVETLPDLSDVFDKYKNITGLHVYYQPNFKSIQRNQLVVVRRIKALGLEGNQIQEFSPDTFDDLSELEVLELGRNGLKVIHRDAFKELYRLKSVGLGYNGLEVLPEGLFRNNHELESVSFYSNNIETIATDFRGLPKLRDLFLNENGCINENLSCDSICNSSTLIEFQTKIWKYCSD